MIFIKIVFRTSKDKSTSMIYQKILIFNYNFHSNTLYLQTNQNPQIFPKSSPTNQNPLNNKINILPLDFSVKCHISKGITVILLKNIGQSSILVPQVCLKFYFGFSNF